MDSDKTYRYLPGGRDYEDLEGDVHNKADLPPDAELETYPTPSRLEPYATATRGLSRTRKPKRRYSRRGGRSFSEPSDSDLDPWWNGKVEDD